MKNRIGYLLLAAFFAGIPLSHAADVPMPSDWHGKKIIGPPQGPNACGQAPDISRIKNKYLDVSYANVSPAEKMDIFLPEQWKLKYPVIINVHGGAFFGCDKMDNPLVPALYGLQKGYAVANINYQFFDDGSTMVRNRHRWTEAFNGRLI